MAVDLAVTFRNTEHRKTAQLEFRKVWFFWIMPEIFGDYSEMLMYCYRRGEQRCGGIRKVE
jgi:hypothetical protein